MRLLWKSVSLKNKERYDGQRQNRRGFAQRAERRETEGRFGGRRRGVGAKTVCGQAEKNEKKIEARNRLFLFGGVHIRGCVRARVLSFAAAGARHTLLYRRRFNIGGVGEPRFVYSRKQLKCEILSRRAKNLY